VNLSTGPQASFTNYTTKQVPWHPRLNAAVARIRTVLSRTFRFLQDLSTIAVSVLNPIPRFEPIDHREPNFTSENLKKTASLNTVLLRVDGVDVGTKTFAIGRRS
jgi:hypothetical protein